MDAVKANGVGGETAALSAFGRQWGTAEMFALGRRANENPPKLYTFSPKGFRRDVVEFHPAYHELMRASINAAALAARLPTMRLYRISTEQGGLVSYGPDVFDLFRRAIELVDKILRGTKPADIPFEQPTKFDLVVNLKTAKGLGLVVPELFLVRADKLVE